MPMAIRKTFFHKAMPGFTMAEILIALLIVAQIATFTIPKVLVSQQNSRFKAVAKETAAMVSGAYQQAQRAGLNTATMHIGNLTQYMNYTKLDSTSLMDSHTTDYSLDCTNTTWYRCLKLHNGATLIYTTAYSFGGTATTNALWFFVDPDSTYSGTTNGTGKSEKFFLYYTGRISTIGSIAPNACNSGACDTADPADEAAWFSW